MSSGKQYENDIAKRVYRATDDTITAYRCGFSGSNAFPQPDIVVSTPTANHGIELKKTASDTFYIEAADIEQLVACQTPSTIVWLVVKFAHRAPVCLRYFDGALDGSDEQFSAKPSVEKFVAVTPDAFEPHITDAGNLRLRKPSTDDWPSAQSSPDDHIVLLSELGIENETSWTL